MIRLQYLTTEHNNHTATKACFAFGKEDFDLNKTKNATLIAGFRPLTKFLVSTGSTTAEFLFGLFANLVTETSNCISCGIRTIHENITII